MFQIYAVSESKQAREQTALYTKYQIRTSGTLWRSPQGLLRYLFILTNLTAHSFNLVDNNKKSTTVNNSSISLLPYTYTQYFKIGE